MPFYGFIFISILGTILHFTYDLSNHNKYVGLFSSVNESVWEHMKLVVFPSLIWTLIEIPFLKDNHNFIFAKFTGLITMLFLIPFLFYLLKRLLKKSYLLLDILIFYIAVGAGEVISFYILKANNIPDILNYLSLIGLIIIYGYFLIATLIPGKSIVYNDPKTNKKGIEAHFRKL